MRFYEIAEIDAGATLMSRKTEFLSNAMEALRLIRSASIKLDFPALSYLLEITMDQVADDLREVRIQERRLRLVRNGDD